MLPDPYKYIPVPKKLTVENILPARLDLCSLMHTVVEVLLSKLHKRV